MSKQSLRRGLPLTMIALAAVSAVSGVRAATRDVAFTYRMGAGYPGDVNRMHPASIEPVKINTTTPPTLYGSAVVVDTATNSVRKMAAGDTALTKLYGIMVRPYPTQQSTGGMSAALGSAAPPVAGVADVLRDGYAMTKVNGTPTKGGTVYLWIAADSGNHVQGMFEAASGGASTITVANALFNGPPDASGNVEIQVWKA